MFIQGLSEPHWSGKRFNSRTFGSCLQDLQLWVTLGDLGSLWKSDFSVIFPGSLILSHRAV